MLPYTFLNLFKMDFVEFTVKEGIFQVENSNSRLDSSLICLITTTFLLFSNGICLDQLKCFKRKLNIDPQEANGSFKRTKNNVIVVRAEGKLHY